MVKVQGGQYEAVRCCESVYGMETGPLWGDDIAFRGLSSFSVSRLALR